jgi:hypothetical protein
MSKRGDFMDYVLLVCLFLVGQAVAYYVGRRDERRTIQNFCDDIGLSDIIYSLNDALVEDMVERNKPDTEMEKEEK